MIKLYAYESCPYCDRVRAKLAELKIEYTTIDVDFMDKPEAVVSTGGTVPVIDDEGMIMNESAEIIKYLEEKYGNK